MQRELSEKNAEEEARVQAKVLAAKTVLGERGAGAAGIVETGDETVDALQEGPELACSSCTCRACSRCRRRSFTD